MSKSDSINEAGFETITENLIERDSVNFIGFGSFRILGTRAGQIKIKGNFYDISTSISVKFKAGKILNSKVSSSK